MKRNKPAITFSRHSDEWETPQALFDGLNLEFGFTIDVCATKKNTKCKRYFTEQGFSLVRPWDGEVCWMNPPYSQVDLWIKKAYEESRRPFNPAVVVCLVYARTDTVWFHKYALKGEIRFLKGRLTFSGASDRAPAPSMLVIFR